MSVAVADSVNQADEETAAAVGAEWIDDFRLSGLRSWHRRGGPLNNRGWATQVVHFSGNHRGSLSEGGFLAIVVRGIPEKSRQTGAQAFPASTAKRRSEAASRVSCGKAIERPMALMVDECTPV